MRVTGKVGRGGFVMRSNQRSRWGLFVRGGGLLWIGWCLLLLLLSILIIRPRRGCIDRIDVSRWGLFVWSLTNILFIIINNIIIYCCSWWLLLLWVIRRSRRGWWSILGYPNRRSRWGLLVLSILLLLFLEQIDEVDEHVIASRRSRWGLMMMIVIVVCCCRKSLWFKLQS